MNFLLIITITYFCSHSILIAESQPMFCSQTRYDAVFNCGPFLSVRKGNWVWNYDLHLKRMREPRNQSDFAHHQKHWLIKTSFWISHIPLCPPIGSEECKKLQDNYEKAKYLVPILVYDIHERYEHTIVVRINERGIELKVETPGYPWNMDTFFNNIWPEEWAEDKLKDRAAVYWPNRFQVMFITGNGNKERSAISFNTIMVEKWWKSLRRQHIHSSVHFLGMFNLGGYLYAFGDNRHNGNNHTKLYDITVSERNTFNITESSVSVQQFFGCDITAITKRNDETDDIDDRFMPEIQKEVKDHNKPSVIVIIAAVVVVILVFIAALIALIVFIILRKKKHSNKDEVTVNAGTDNNAGTSSSIYTIDSYTGKNVGTDN